MAKRSFLKPLALTVATLLATAAGTATATIESQKTLGQSAKSISSKMTTVESEFVLQRSTASEEMKTAYHSSHYSHRSHSSHQSHSSHYSGYYN